MVEYPDLLRIWRPVIRVVVFLLHLDIVVIQDLNSKIKKAGFKKGDVSSVICNFFFVGYFTRI
jgi:hypothetical protein